MINKSVLSVVVSFLAAYSSPPAFAQSPAGAIPDPAATSFTKERNKIGLRELPFADEADFRLVKRGLIENVDGLVLKSRDGRIVRDNRVWSFLNGDAPDTVNPSLWRNAKLNNVAGLFRVVDHVYQVRGFDGAVMSIIEGKTGIIVVDPLMATETSAAALDLYFKHRPRKPVVALVYTHAHSDHYAGAGGVVNPADVAEGKVQVIAPEGFMNDVLAEWMVAGPLMMRRATYMAGLLLPPSPGGLVDSGIGKINGYGTPSLIQPTTIIEKPGGTLVIDGVTFDFRVATDAEAPAELTFYLPDYKALCLAEVANQSMHQLYTLRGARVRDAVSWSNTLRAAARDYGPTMKAVFVSHGWPHFEDAAEYIENQADMYQFIHDQTVRLANEGLTMNEIAETLKLPPSLGGKWYNRGYYGTVSHNSKGVYQYYFGWFDGNPSNLNPLPPQEAGKRYVAAMGGADAVLQRAKQSYEQADYRWAVELLNHVLAADPRNGKARSLSADAMTQMGYQAESALWRNFYLSGAYELRQGRREFPLVTPLDQYAAVIDVPMLLRSMAVRVNGDRAQNKEIKIDLAISDTGQRYDVRLHNAVLSFTEAGKDVSDAPLRISRAQLTKIVADKLSAANALKEGASGDFSGLEQVLAVLDPYRNDQPLAIR